MTQLYCSFKARSLDEVLRLVSTCISDIRAWMIKNKLKINDDKTELLIISSPHAKLSQDIHLSIGEAEILPSSACKSLGVTLDNHMTMDKQIKSICRSTM